MTSLAFQTNKASATYGDVIFVTTNGAVTDALFVGSPYGTQQQEILQSIIEALSIFRGEWFMDVTIGIDYFGQVFVKNPNMSAINALLITTIINVPGVNTLMSYSFQPSFLTRTLNITFSCETVAGIVNYSGLT